MLIRQILRIINYIAAFIPTFGMIILWVLVPFWILVLFAKEVVSSVLELLVIAPYHLSKNFNTFSQSSLL
jgi:hypothetical protein